MGKYLIQEAFRLFYPKYRERHSVTPEQESAAQCIMGCKDGTFGFTKSVCPQCGHEEVHYASCGNRNCPCCQGTKPEEWVDSRNSELIDGIPYFHVIMTVPHELNPLFLSSPGPMCRLLMQSATGAVLEVASREKNLGAAPGIVSVLHTWGQTLELHPHVHMLVAGAGLASPTKLVQCWGGKFFCPLGHLAGAFRQRFLDGTKKLRSADGLSFAGQAAELRNHHVWEELLDVLYHKQWNVKIKETFNGRGNAVEYLSRYAYRTAISNSRIISVTEDGVAFSWKDYKDGGNQKMMTLKGEEFIRRFLLHILPKGFSRIRYGGFLSNGCKKKNLKLIRRLRGAAERTATLRGLTARQRIFSLFNVDICRCPLCSGEMYMRRFLRDRMQC